MKNDDISISLAQQDEKVLKHLFDTYFTPLCQFMYAYWDNKQEIEEEAMDIFVYLWQHPEKINSELSIKSYLFQAARHKCLSLLRNKRQVVSLDELKEELVFEEFSLLENEELNMLIQRAILAIPVQSREIFLKSRNDRLSNKEIAEGMNISLKTVEKHITRSLKILKEVLGDQYFFFFLTL